MDRLKLSPDSMADLASNQATLEESDDSLGASPDDGVAEENLMRSEIVKWFNQGLDVGALTERNWTSVPSIASQETDVEIHSVSFTWIIREFTCFRDHAYLAALPHMQNFIESSEFGNSIVGKWYIMLFPNGETSSKESSAPNSGGILAKVVSINKQSVTAKASFSILDRYGKEIPGRRKSFGSYKWFQTSLYYNAVTICSEEEMDSFLELLADDVLRLKCNLQVCTSIREVPEGYGLIKDELVGTTLDKDLTRFSEQVLCRDIEVKATEVIPFPEGREKSGYPEGNNINEADFSIVRSPSGSIYQRKVKGSVMASKFVLSARSSVLKIMLSSAFAEGKSSCISLGDIDLDVLKNFIDYLHTDSCTFLGNSLCKRLEENRKSDDAEYAKLTSVHKYHVSRVILLLKLATKYDCQNLKLRCIVWLIENITDATVGQIDKVSTELSIKPLMVHCQRKLQDKYLRGKGLK